MKIVYFGTSSFAVPALKAVSNRVSLVVSQPDKPSGRGMRLTASPVKAAAIELGLPVVTPDRARNAEFVQSIRKLEADFLLVAAYGQILSVDLLESSAHGGINLHGSILPKYRGAAPIQRCIEAGDTETGVSLMQMDKGMDTGDVIAIERLTIGPDETAGELQTRLAELAATWTCNWAERLATGQYPRIPQDHENSTHAAKVSKADAELRFDEPIETVYNRFRAFTPAPGAWIQTKFGRLKISKARKGDYGPGSIAFGGGSLELLEVQPEGRGRMTGAEFFRGHHIQTGDQLRP
ncbi:MAG: methionyl-tRNA formyltransferase [Fimbriimonadaceae bacterium]